MWDDCEFGVTYDSKYSTYFDDFHTFDTDQTEWTLTQTNAGSTVLSDEANGALLITTDTADNDSEEYQLLGESFLPAAGRNIWFEARYNVSHASDLDYLIGLSATDTAMIDNNANAIFFSGTDDTAAIDFKVTGSSILSSATGLKTTVAATYYKVGFKVIGTSAVEYYVDDVFAGTIKTNIPTTEMRISFAVQAGSNAARALEIDYIKCVQTRI